MQNGVRARRRTPPLSHRGPPARMSPSPSRAEVREGLPIIIALRIEPAYWTLAHRRFDGSPPADRTRIQEGHGRPRLFRAVAASHLCFVARAHTPLWTRLDLYESSSAVATSDWAPCRAVDSSFAKYCIRVPWT